MTCAALHLPSAYNLVPTTYEVKIIHSWMGMSHIEIMGVDLFRLAGCPALPCHARCHVLDWVHLDLIGLGWLEPSPAGLTNPTYLPTYLPTSMYPQQSAAVGSTDPDQPVSRAVHSTSVPT